MASPPERSHWLRALLAAKFFCPCEGHQLEKKNEANVFCMGCHVSMCQHCMEDHQGHKLLQIRRYVYHDVVRLADINKLVDCSGVQAYTINSARVVFLNERPQPRPTKSSNTCRTCERSLQEEFQFCSLGCKVTAANSRAKVGESPTKKAVSRKRTNQDRGRGNMGSPSSALKAAASVAVENDSNAGQVEDRHFSVTKAEESNSSDRIVYGEEKDATISPADEGSSGVSDAYPSSEEDEIEDAAASRDPLESEAAKKHHRDGGKVVHRLSPKSVLPGHAGSVPISAMVSPSAIRSLFQRYDAMMGCMSPSSKRRKSMPQRSPAF